MDTEATMLGELRGLRRRLPAVSGVVLATVDGLLLASDAPNINPEPVAALSATSFGLALQFAHAAGHGPVRDSVIQAAGGIVVIYPAGHALLAVLAGHDVDPVLLHGEAQRLAHRIGACYEGTGGWQSPPTTPTSLDRCSPRAGRMPTSMSPAGLPLRSPIRRPPRRP
ncbi:MAG TPA: roadblock/LC7 domain-containing protein [Micromonosporaceae bacterium]|nr:roadblock/LC7 domain-containing protein [Micromonosporaceae bacterium]